MIKSFNTATLKKKSKEKSLKIVKKVFKNIYKKDSKYKNISNKIYN